MTTEARELLVKQARQLGKHGPTLILALALALAPKPNQARKLGKHGPTLILP